MGVVIGIDFGTKYLGIALSDETKTVAAPLTSITVGKGKSLSGAAAKYLKTIPETIDLIVIGSPKGFDNKPTQMSLLAEEFAEKLGAKLGLPYRIVGETYTSASAEQLVYPGSDIHSRSAMIILQTYLDNEQKPNR